MKHILNAITLMICFAILSFGISFHMHNPGVIGWIVFIGNMLVSGVTTVMVMKNVRYD